MGTYAISGTASNGSGSKLSDYSVTLTAGILTVTQATPTVTATDYGGVYSGSTFPASASVTGVNDTTIAQYPSSPSITFLYTGTSGTSYGPTSDAPSAIGSYNVVAHYSGSTDYTYADSNPTTFSIVEEVWVDQAWANTSPNATIDHSSISTAVIPGNITLIYGKDAFSTVQGGVSALEGGVAGPNGSYGTVEVLPGEYDLSSGVAITQPLNIIGAMAGVSGTDSSRGTGESILTDTSSTPMFSFPNLSLSGSVNVSGFDIVGSAIANANGGSSVPAMNLTFQDDVFQLTPVANDANIHVDHAGLSLIDNAFTETGSNGDSIVWAFNTASLTVTGNTFTGDAGNSVIGLQLDTDSFNSATPGIVQSNAFNGLDIGIMLAGITGNLQIEQNTFENITRGPENIAAGSLAADILVFPNGIDNPFIATVTVSDNTFKDSDSAIRTSNVGGTVNGANFDITGNTFSGDVYDFVDRAAGTISPDGTNIFDNVTLGSASLTQMYAIEDKIVDAIDVSGYGLVRLAPHEIYVTPNSFYAPDGTTAPSIQRAIDAASDFDTVNIEAGTYVADDNYIVSGSAVGGVGQEVAGLNIDKPLTLLGPNAGYDRTSNLTPANDQAIIVPGHSDPNPYDTTAVIVVYVGSSNVTIKGLTIDGINSALPSHYYDNGTGGYTGYVNANSSDAIDAAELIASYANVCNITVENNIVENAGTMGLDFNNGADYSGGATSHNLITNNLIQNLSGDYYYGDGVNLYNNFYAAVTNNVMANVAVGVQIGNFSQANPLAPRSESISGNQISAGVMGIWYNLAYQDATPLPVSDNSITAVANNTPFSFWYGVLVSTAPGGITPSFDGNKIDGSEANSSVTVGYDVWDNPAVTISGGTVKGVQYGVWANSYEGLDQPGGERRSHSVGWASPPARSVSTSKIATRRMKLVLAAAPRFQYRPRSKAVRRLPRMVWERASW